MSERVLLCYSLGQWCSRSIALEPLLTATHMGATGLVFSPYLAFPSLHEPSGVISQASPPTVSQATTHTRVH